MREKMNILSKHAVCGAWKWMAACLVFGLCFVSLLHPSLSEAQAPGLPLNAPGPVDTFVDEDSIQDDEPFALDGESDDEPLLGRGSGLTPGGGDAAECREHELEYGRCGILFPEMTSLSTKIVVVVMIFGFFYLLFAFAFFKSGLNDPDTEPLNRLGQSLGLTVVCSVFFGAPFVAEYSWRGGWCDANLALCSAGTTLDRLEHVRYEFWLVGFGIGLVAYLFAIYVFRRTKAAS
jgi:hypothetical protein